MDLKENQGSSHIFHQLLYFCVQPCDTWKGRFARYKFCSQLLYATFVARATRVRQISYTICHSNILILAMTVVGF